MFFRAGRRLSFAVLVAAVVAAATVSVAVALDSALSATPTPERAAVTAPAFSTTASTTESFSVRWQAADSTAYDVEVKRDLGGAWQSWQTGTSARQATYAAPAPGTYFIRARGIAGDELGAWSPVVSTVVPVDDASSNVVYRGTWTQTSAASTAFMKTLHSSSSVGSSCSFAFVGRSVALICDKGPKHGKLRVYVGRAKRPTATIDTFARPHRPRQLVFTKTWPRSAAHTLRVKVLGTPGRPTVAVDALAAPQLDSAAPFISGLVLNGGAQFTRDAAVAVTLTASDDVAVAEMLVATDQSFEGASWQPFAPSFLLPIAAPNGVKSVYVEVRDDAGGVSPPATATITRDTASPSFASVTGDAQVTPGEAASVEVQVGDAGAGVAAVTLHYRQVGGGSFSDAPLSYAGGSWSGAIPADKVTTTALEYYLTAADAVGNEAASPADAPSSLWTLTPRDITPPPVPQGVTATLDGDHVVVAWQPVDAPDLDHYVVTRSVDGGAFDEVGQPTAATFVDSTVHEHHSYGYRVAAVDNAGNASQPSDPSSVEVPQRLAGFRVEAPATAHVGEPFSVTITALDGNGDVFTGYAGVVTLEAVDGSGQLTPAAATAFVAGVRMVELTYDTAETIKVRASDGTAEGRSDGILLSQRQPTYVSGTINEDTTWTEDRSPYVVDGTVTVPAGVTLTVEPGAIVKFRPYAGLSISGSLVAQGSAAQPIAFTSLNDNTVGGDTNGDGSATTPAAGDWGNSDYGGINVGAAGSLAFANVTVSYGYGLRLTDGATGATFDHCTIRTIRGTGISAGSGASTSSTPLTVTDSVISGTTSYGIGYTKPRDALRISGTTFSNNGASSVMLWDPVGASKVTGNTFVSASQWPLFLQGTVGGLDVSGNSASGANAGIELSSVTITADTTLPSGIPYVVNNGNLNVGTDARLTVAPGAVLKFLGPANGLRVWGSLVAQGSAAQPIAFTSLNDNTVGGDTNGDGSATTPAAGDWGNSDYGGINVGAAGSLAFANVTVSYGYGLRLTDGATGATFDHCTIRTIRGTGISAGSGASTSSTPLTVTDSVISGTTSYGIGYTKPRDALRISGTTFSNNGASSVMLWDPVGASKVTGNTFVSASQWPLFLQGTVGGLDVSGNSASGANAGIELSSVTITADTTLPSGIPYVVNNGNLNVGTDARLTVAPGAVLKFLGPANGLRVWGSLVAQGSAAQPIAFTSLNDDTVGGDTNGDGGATTPAPRDWANNYGDYGGIDVYGGDASILNAIVRYSIRGLSASNGGRLSITSSAITDNIQGIAALSTTPTIHAENCWWGSTSGPAPYGSGNGVSYHWATNSAGKLCTVVDVSVVPWVGYYSLCGANFGKVGWGGYAADPVNVTIGNYTYDTKDLSIATRGLPLEVVRSYNSQAAIDAPFGLGWAFSYGANLSIDDANDLVTVTREDGRQLQYAEQTGGGYLAPAGVHDALTKEADGTYRLTTKTQQVFAFDSAGKLVSIADRNGNTTSVQYSASSIAAVTAPDGRQLLFTTDPGGHVTQITDPLSRTWSYAYDTNGELVSVTDPADGVTHYAYDADHRLTTMTDANGHDVVSNTYDANGHVVRQKDASGAETVYGYDVTNRTTYVTDPLGRTTTYAYDEAFRITRGTTPRGATTTTAYDSDNNKTAISDPRSHTTSYVYDSRGNLTGTTNAAGDVASTTYDATNNPLTKTDFAGKTWSYSYDEVGNLLTETDPLAHVVSHAYDDSGQLATTTDQRGKTTTFAHDAEGNLTEIKLPSEARTMATYDAAGRMLTGADALGKTTTYAYDALDRLLSVTDPLGHSVSATYDAVGNRLTMTDERGKTTSFAYDQRNDLVKVSDALGHDTTYDYDVNRHLVQATDTNGHATSYAYNADGQRTGVTDPLGRSPVPPTIWPATRPRPPTPRARLRPTCTTSSIA